MKTGPCQPKLNRRERSEANLRRQQHQHVSYFQIVDVDCLVLSYCECNFIPVKEVKGNARKGNEGQGSINYEVSLINKLTSFFFFFLSKRRRTSAHKSSPELQN